MKHILIKIKRYFLSFLKNIFGIGSMAKLADEIRKNLLNSYIISLGSSRSLVFNLKRFPGRPIGLAVTAEALAEEIFGRGSVVPKRRKWLVR